MSITIDSTRVTRVTNDNNGNPRIVIHWTTLECCEALQQWSMSQRQGDNYYTGGLQYTTAQGIASNAGFKKFHNKQYGGGLVCQSYNTQDSLDDLQYACEVFVAENTHNQSLTDHVLFCIDLSEHECKDLHKIIKSEKRVTRLNSRIVEDWLRGLPTACTVEFMDYEQGVVMEKCGLIGWTSDMYWRYAAKVILTYKG